MSTAGSETTLFHVTHWKAGSVWIEAILRSIAPQRVVDVKPKAAHFRGSPVEPGSIYPRVYVTREVFDGVSLPEGAVRFVVIRDLRDTFISTYFSLKFSHTTDQLPKILAARKRLRSVSFKEGLEFTMTHPMVADSAAIQRSWIEAGEPLIRYEDLLENDAEILEHTLIDRCGLEVDPMRVRTAVLKNRFAAMSGGRTPGQEDPFAHQRKGVAGEWRDHLRGSLKEQFKERWGDVLIAAGYEQDMDW